MEAVTIYHPAQYWDSWVREGGRRGGNTGINLIKKELIEIKIEVSQKMH
jgi:hypothetical protein